MLCCSANRTAQRIQIYASQFGFLCALHLNIFEQPHGAQLFIAYQNIIFRQSQHF